MILTQIIMGITTGGNILMGQYFGSKDRSNRVKTNRTMFGFALSAGALLSVLLFLLSRPILAALRAPALEEATAYLQVCSAGLIAIFGYNALAAMLRSVGNSKQPFYCVAVTAGCNIALDCLDVYKRQRFGSGCLLFRRWGWGRRRTTAESCLLYTSRCV